MMRYFFQLALILLFLTGCSLQKNVLKQITETKNPKLSKVFKDPEKYELQIMYSRIIRENEKVEFKDYKFRVDPEAYFYPASTVKLPVAVLSLEKISELQEEGIDIYKNTTYRLENDTVAHNISDDIDRIFAVSDNDSYNRLFEFLGQDFINSKLRAKGVAPVRISHRFSGENSGATSTRKMIFELNDGKYEMPVTNNKEADSLRIFDVIKGKGYIKDEEQVDEPFSFAFKNYFPLEAQHNLMKRLFFTEYFIEWQRFRLSEEDHEFLKTAMSRLPREMDYDETEYYDSYGKFFLYGDSKDRIPANVKIYNKVGYAYGTLTETAYVVDEVNDVEFILSATMLVNENQIFNDNDYEYDEIGIPFLAELGRQIYQKELKSRK